MLIAVMRGVIGKPSPCAFFRARGGLAYDRPPNALGIHLWNNNMVKPRGGLVLVG